MGKRVMWSDKDQKASEEFNNLDVIHDFCKNSLRGVVGVETRWPWVQMRLTDREFCLSTNRKAGGWIKCKSEKGKKNCMIWL